MPDSQHSLLRMNYSGRIIDQLGIQMYQSPVAAVAELIANAWDADAEIVRVSLPEEMHEAAEIVVEDDGIGMSFEECEKRYLNVGFCRRGSELVEHSKEKGRPILGRKGIGKFAGFGVAKKIRVETISKDSREKTVFEMDLDNLRRERYVRHGHEISVIEYEGNFRRADTNHGTRIVLKVLKLRRNISEIGFKRSMARRFLLHRRVADFRVTVNGEELPEGEENTNIEFVFPRDYKKEERPEGMVMDDDWGEEELNNGRRIRWQICFYKKPIDEEELRGVSIFLHGKLAQSPFFFNLSGGLGGQHGQEYMSGQVEADYLDELEDDYIATERQRLDFKGDESIPLLDWGQDRVKTLLRIWQNRRAQKKVELLNKKIAPFTKRLDKLPSHERKVIRKAITNLAKVSALEEAEFIDLGQSLLAAWEGGRLKELIEHLSEVELMNTDELLNILVEEEVLSSLNIAEGVKTKILTVGELKKLIQKGELENTIRDYIADHPWLVAPELQTFVKEMSLKKLLDKLAKEYKLPHGKGGKRVDLVLRSADHLVVIEFMQPGQNLNTDHLGRYDLYFRAIKTNVISANTGGNFQRFTGYIVADGLERDPVMLDKIQSMRLENMLALDWDNLINRALDGWREFLEVLASRDPKDDRLKALLDDLS